MSTTKCSLVSPTRGRGDHLGVSCVSDIHRRVWYPAVRASVGEPMRPHDLRTAYDIYGHLFEGRDRQAADALEAAQARSLADFRGLGPDPKGPRSASETAKSLANTGDFVMWS